MTDNVKSSILSKKVSSSNGLEPRLRFPEFRDPYTKTLLGNITKRIQRKDPDSDAPIMMLSAASGFINQSEKYSRDNAGQSLTKYTILNRGELAYNHGASKLKPYGCCFALQENCARVPYVYHCFSVHDNNIAYVASLLNNRKTDKQLKRLISSSVRMDGLLNIAYEDYMGIELCLPSTLEQQKIAEFLSLVDERIEKQRQLVAALKRYKRGVLIEIFKNISNHKKLFEISEYKSSSNTLINIASEQKGLYPIYDASGIAAYIDKYDMEQEYISIVKDGSGVGRTSFCQGKSSFIGTLGAIIPKACNPKYLYTVLQTMSFFQFITGMAIPHIYYRDYKHLDIPFPSTDEQIQIATFYEALEHLIEHQDTQLGRLNTLKNCFLQQMFI